MLALSCQFGASAQQARCQRDLQRDAFGASTCTDRKAQERLAHVAAWSVNDAGFVQMHSETGLSASS